jgi:hypothetical protein
MADVKQRSSDDISVAREAAKAFVDKVLIEDENYE